MQKPGLSAACSLRHELRRRLKHAAQAVEAPSEFSKSRTKECGRSMSGMTMGVDEPWAENAEAWNAPPAAGASGHELLCAIRLEPETVWRQIMWGYSMLGNLLAAMMIMGAVSLSGMAALGVYARRVWSEQDRENAESDAILRAERAQQIDGVLIYSPDILTNLPSDRKWRRVSQYRHRPARCAT